MDRGIAYYTFSGGGHNISNINVITMFQVHSYKIIKYKRPVKLSIKHKKELI